MALVPQTIQVDLLGTDTKTGAKRLAPGRASVMENVRQDTRGVLRKRNGHALYTTAVDAGTFNNLREILSADGQLVARTIDTVFAYDATRTTWRNRGRVSRVRPSYLAATSRGYKPSQIQTSGYTYSFAGQHNIRELPVDRNRKAWSYRITDTATGAEVMAETTVPTVLGWQAKPVVAGGYVWLFVGCAEAVPGDGFYRYLYVAKFDPANPTAAPTVTTYLDAGAGQSIAAWDVQQITGGAFVVVSGSANVAATGQPTVASKLDTATGLPLVSPGLVATGNTATAAPVQGFPLQLVKNVDTGTTGSFYLVYRAAASLRGISFNSTSLVASALSGAITWSGTLPTVLTAVRRAATAQLEIYGSVPGTTPATSTVVRSIVTAAFANVSQNVVKRGVSVVGEAVDHPAAIYIPVICDDNSVGLQSSYALMIGSQGEIVARTLYGQGGDAYQHASREAITAADMGWVTPNVITGTRIYLDVSTWDGTEYRSATIALETDNTVATSPASTVALGGASAVLPGGWPRHLTAGAPSIEYIGMFPQGVVASPIVSGGFFPAAGIYSVALCYLHRDNRGRVTRSAPSATTTATLNGSTQILQLVIPTLRMTNTSAGDFWIEVYLSAPGGATLFLQRGLTANYPTVDSVTVTFGSADMSTGGEVLYTQSGELPNDPPPPCSVSTTWGRRTFLSGTDVPGEIWPSKEVAEGRGLEFSLGSVFNLPGSEVVTAMAALDDNYLAIFTATGLYYVQGTGPDATGRGAYEPLRLAGNRGATSARSVVSTEKGVFFQDQGGRICLLDRSLQIVDLGDGPFGYDGLPVTAAAYSSAARQVHLHYSDGTRWVLDVEYADQANPNGYWYHDTNVGAAGTCEYGGVPHHTGGSTVRREVVGQYFDDTNTPILRKVTLPLVLAGTRGNLRVKRFQVLGQLRSQHDLKVTYKTFAGTAGEVGATSQSWTKTITTSSPELVEARPNQGLASVVEVTIEDVGSNVGQGGTLDALAFEVGVRQGLPRVSSGQRL